jgi:hypothetical protein
VKLLWCLLFQQVEGLFIAVRGRWSAEATGARHDRTYDFPPFVVDGPDARSLVGCESLSWVGSAGFHAS